MYHFNERLEYFRACFCSYSPEDILLWLHKNCSGAMDVRYECSKYFCSFFIPGLTVCGVSLFLARYTVKDLYGYDCSLEIPHSLEDLSLFKSIVCFFEYRAGRQPQLFANANDAAHRANNLRLVTKLNGADTVSVWQQTLDFYTKEIAVGQEAVIPAFNGVLHFSITPQFLKIPAEAAGLRTVLLPAVAAYIWQPALTGVSSTEYTVAISKNGERFSKTSLKAFLWNNQQTQLVDGQWYLLFEMEGKWQAVRHRLWWPALSPFLTQYDALTSGRLLPVLANEIFHALKTVFAANASALSISCTAVNNELVWEAVV